ncbi:hypothetical protein GCK72_002679 [Caenorhabditis remanei]|uniref:C2H2-type domain-containing protein n=1 Tax=Caenorhabditis remanei TaxID=31234 RepID=A0A6A5HTG3_CAERE|nr:hypothetical protein GCK72_002679 [Caenorhabditis remanei]KAF1770855.1 hypothetical protein GCK72_002679 [Caenorhabditis remanei]
MNFQRNSVFTSVTHGLSADCRQANAKLRQTLESYNFGAFLMEKTCSKCPNDDCNTSFIFILQQRDFFRLKNQVQFEIPPTFIVHNSFSELLEADRKIRKKLLEDNSLGIQVGPEMANKLVDACPPVCNIMCQTDFKVGKRDMGDQTEEIVRKDAESQSTPEEPIISAQSSDSIHMPTETNTSFINRHESVVRQLESPLRTIEVQQEQDDDDVVIRPRNGPPMTVKQEEPAEEPTEEVAATVPVNVEPIKPAREVKDEMIEEAPEEVMQPLIEPPVEKQIAPPPAGTGITVELETPAAITPSTPNNLNHSFVTSMASLMSNVSTTSTSDSFYSPASSNTSMSESTGGSAKKRLKFSDVEMCSTCWAVSYYTKLEEYCSHVLEMHAAIPRFKCTICDKRLGSTISANHHIRFHPEQGDVANPQALIVPEVSEESIQKFIRAAIQCYPEKFRNVQSDEIYGIIRNLP